MLVKENAQVLFRRKQIISEMVNLIYPITEVYEFKNCFLNKSSAFFVINLFGEYHNYAKQ